MKERELLQIPAFVTGCNIIEVSENSAHEYTHTANHYVNLVPTAPSAATTAADGVISHSIFHQGLLILSLQEFIIKFYRKYCILFHSLLADVSKKKQHTYKLHSKETNI
jgi:hypothetical protein